MHSALRETHKLPWDIYERALTWFFDTDEYQLWLDTNRTWQLRCIGAPGTGKVLTPSPRIILVIYGPAFPGFGSDDSGGVISNTFPRR